ncbi:MAG: hypothetical protein A3F84_19370 [Candidatus Handelsmanbacteria bacterium RIFCSPLOWO2_12_FULL_64_10]|uniref:PorV/PorQ family protein n=1 Tax=Handelsmanbacteria sp. (strain RIFCSPLOWO2_12_FULL_64_10) TaxID=1817868 RepID=A0A1F6CSS3_HANXR|nr:MAG: hypothetical protein A3F84_19370 [Candidatus Handelsmanbacteria bacterium RIFCSPLOWO2_12_FULL_64_10]
MGGAGVALTGDQVAAGENPGALATLKGRDFLLTHHELFAGIRQEYAGAAFGNGRRGVGFGFAVRTAGGLERRAGPSAQPLGTFSVYDADFSLRYAQQVAGVSAGVGVRVVHETVEADGASGVVVDLGGVVRTLASRLTVGAALRNLGRMGALNRSPIRLPLSLRAGAVYRSEFVSGRDHLLIASEMDFPRDGDAVFRGGGEYVWRGLLAARVGYEAGRDAQGASFGFGVRRRGWRFDYALTPYRYGLGNAHRVSIGLE